MLDAFHESLDMCVQVGAAWCDLDWSDIDIREYLAEGLAESSIVVHDHVSLVGQKFILAVGHVHEPTTYELHLEGSTFIASAHQRRDETSWFATKDEFFKRNTVR